MNIFVSGSLAYDRIMSFPGRFADHIMPDKLHMINVSFAVSGLVERMGGTAGNIAYSLRLLGEQPTIIATIGRDYHPYFQRLNQMGIGRDGIKVVDQEVTACAYIITDRSDNQITAFNPGAMNHPSSFDLQGESPDESIGIIAPGNLEDMMVLSQTYRAKGIRFIFDPGQSLPIWDGKALSEAIQGSYILISNDYELALITERTGLDKRALLDLTQTIVTTRGEAGSIITTRDDEESIPSIPRPETLVDPTGAGDAYRGGLIKGLIDGKNLSESARLGTTCASFAIEVQGTQEYTFTVKQFNARLKRHFSP